MTPLINNAVSANALETSVMKLWQEFLARYFDGGKHDVGATPLVQFPLAELLFQQSAAGQPLAASGGLAITLVSSEVTRRKWVAWENYSSGLTSGLTSAATRQEICYEAVAWNFWVRANGTNGRALCKSGSDGLFGLLSNKGETHALGQKGICRLKVHAPRVIQETDYVLRLVSLGATLRYPILSQRYVDECGAGDLDPGAGDGGQSGLGAGS
jgi:hypothetical protein